MKNRSSAMKYLIEGKFLVHLRMYMDKAIGYVTRRLIYRTGEIENNKIFIMTYDNEFNCNPKYIANELIRRKLPVDIVWAVSSLKSPHIEEFPKQIRLVKRGSYEMFEEQASAKVWIDNALNCVWFEMPKKKGQIYFNTWHGSLGIKRLSGNRTWMWHARYCDKKTDYCITNSSFEENVFRDTFWPHVNFLKFGHARNDILFADSEEKRIIKDKVCTFYNLPKNVNIFLYAPTFRDNGSQDAFLVDYDEIRQALFSRFGGEWVVLARAHFKNLRNENKIKKDVSWVLDGTLYRDMQELMIAADVGLTDYSSWAYDFVLTRKPLFIYAPDIDKYDQMRGFYYPISSTPFPVSYTIADLVSNIKNFNDTEYKKKVDAFLKDKGCYEMGNAAKRIVDKIVEVMGIQK